MQSIVYMCCIIKKVKKGTKVECGEERKRQERKADNDIKLNVGQSCRCSKGGMVRI